MFFKIGVFKFFCNIHKKTSVLESLFNKVAEFLQRLFYRTPLVDASVTKANKI